MDVGEWHLEACLVDNLAYLGDAQAEEDVALAVAAGEGLEISLEDTRLGVVAEPDEGFLDVGGSNHGGNICGRR